jgi:exo-beta-1,3-glucanase (GH17 family)/cellulose synthase/poly-beta-1,6-N-acetylglucosamine synthase-like glycosyltransferase
VKNTLARTLAGLTLIAAANLSAWAWFNRPQDPAAAWNGKIRGVSFSPLRENQEPGGASKPSASELDADLTLLADTVGSVRTYGTRDGLELVPALAGRHNLEVTAGAWIGADAVENFEELRNLIRLGQNHSNIRQLLVGNEALLRGDVRVEQLIRYINGVRRLAGREVGTAETWKGWLAHPELADSVDFIAVHILPYWEGVHVDKAVDYVFERYAEVEHAYPGKRIVLAEVGWPSAGLTIGDAVPSRVNQAKFLRTFLNRVEGTGIDYFIVEAFDQPWKAAFEGSVGAYWGLYSFDRAPKFSMRGSVIALPTWKQWALLAGFMSLIPAFWFWLGNRGVGLRGKVLFAVVANVAASVIAWSAALGADQYHTAASATIWIALVLMQAFALMVLMVETIEAAHVLWRRNLARDFRPFGEIPGRSYPKVSIHVPIHNEPPQLVRGTLEALARLDYPDYEVLVVDNNTRDPAVWQPVQSLCGELGARFRFFHLENWPGYKAGALNYALAQTSSDAEVIGVIDSDYVVAPQWLKALAPYFENPRVGFVQAPQDYRDGGDSLFKRMCFWEYAGFFHIGMVQRNDYNAIIQHGTMTLIRKEAVVPAGHWAEWCICEDAELGLRLLRNGWDSVYLPESFGRGVIPDTLAAYKTQRFRWAYGAVQIMKRHWRSLMPLARGELSPSQKYHFIAGWLPWLSDGLSLLFVVASLGLTIHVLASIPNTEFPVEAFLFPTLGLFCCKIVRSMWLYAERVRCSFADMLGAAVAGLALAHTVGKAVLAGIFTSGRPFVRTPKLEPQRALSSAIGMVREELLIATALWIGALCVASMEQFESAQGRLWVSVLLVQSAPYLASVLMALINAWPALRLPALRPLLQWRTIQPALRGGP